MTSDDSVHFGPAEKLAKDPERVRKNFWIKIKSFFIKPKPEEEEIKEPEEEQK